MAGRAPQRSLPAAAAAALLLLPIVLHCESSVNLPLSVLLEKYCEALSARTNVTGAVLAYPGLEFEHRTQNMDSS